MGSSPIARLFEETDIIAISVFYSGDVAKWQGKSLQNSHHGFKSHRRLFCIQLFNRLVSFRKFPVMLDSNGFINLASFFQAKGKASL